MRISPLSDATRAPADSIISAPRAGALRSTNSMSTSENVWTIDGESEGVIEGIPALHPANRSYASHRLTEEDASFDIARAIRAGFIAEIRDKSGCRYREPACGERLPSIRLLEKTPENALRVAFLAAVFPDARFIFLHRDPRQSKSAAFWRRGAMRASSTFQPSRVGPRALGIFCFPRAGRNFVARRFRRWLPSNGRQPITARWRIWRRCQSDRWMSVDYAELVASPGTVVERVFKFGEISVDARLAQRRRRPPSSPIQHDHQPAIADQMAQQPRVLREGARASHADHRTAARSRPGQRSAAPAPRLDGACAFFMCTRRSQRLRSRRWIKATTLLHRRSDFRPARPCLFGLLGRTRFRERFSRRQSVDLD